MPKKEGEKSLLESFAEFRREAVRINHKILVFCRVGTVCMFLIFAATNLPSFFECGGKVMNLLGTYGEYKYASRDMNGPDDGLYRSKKTESKYVKLSEYYPVFSDELYSVGDKLYYADNTGCLVKLDSKTGEVTRKINGTNYFKLCAANKSHLIAFEHDSNVLFSVSTSDLEIEKEIKKCIPEKIQISDTGVDFYDRLTRATYHYEFKTFMVRKVIQ